MTDAKKLLLDLLAVIPDGKRTAALFAEDGAVELPYLYAIGIPTRYQGHVAISDFYNFVGGTLYPDFRFKPEDTTVLIETPEQVFAEYSAHTKAARTGRILHHLFAGRLVAKNGKITLLRESLNTVAAAQALNPNGVADLPPPASRIFSVLPDYQS
jgi:ketosteroid isomerase-like protein